MKPNIVWTTQAFKGLERCINFLREEWTLKEEVQLKENLDALILRISLHPNMHPATSRSKNLRKGLIDKNNYIIYKISPKFKRIEIINFRGTRQKPISGM